MQARGKREWFRIENRTDDPTVAHLYIYDDIGKSWWSDDSVTAKAFLEALNKLPKDTASIVVHINSLGGDVFDAAAITNGLRDQRDNKGRTVTTIVEGIAASAASVVAMAGTSIQMADNALMMIHNPWSIEMGEAKDFRAAADALDKIRATIVTTYQWHTAQDADAIGALMDAATWMTADEAIAAGFATDKIATQKAAASISRQALDRVAVPDRFRDRIDAFVQPAPQAPEPADAIAVVKACNAAGFPELTEGFIADKQTLEQVTAALQTATTTRDQTARAEREATEAKAARAKSITALCEQALQPKLATGYIDGGMTTDQVKAHLVVIKAAQDQVEIDTRLSTDTTRPNQPANAAADLTAVYGKLNTPATTKR